jgi:isopentenyl diphosphate isomerase/L-lactate dehydrogenase-like FMN-dependent dehydrogenase
LNRLLRSRPSAAALHRQAAASPQLRGYCLENYFRDETFLRRLSASPQDDLKAATREWIDIWGNSLQWEDLDWLRSLTDLPIALKGICLVTETCSTERKTGTAANSRRARHGLLIPWTQLRILPSPSCPR